MWRGPSYGSAYVGVDCLHFLTTFFAFLGLNAGRGSGAAVQTAFVLLTSPQINGVSAPPMRTATCAG